MDNMYFIKEVILRDETTWTISYISRYQTVCIDSKLLKPLLMKSSGPQNQCWVQSTT